MAKGLCEECGFDYTKKVNVESIPAIVKQICESNNIDFFNIAILDINNLPAFGSTIDINQSIIYQTPFKTEICYYILLDNNHFSPITDIKKFLNVRCFCSKCQKSFVNPKSFIDHDCDVNNDNIEQESDDDNSDDSDSDDNEKKVNAYIKDLETGLQLKKELFKKLKKDNKKIH